MSKKHFPRKGDKVNDKTRIPFANGFVQRVIYDDGPSEVIVKFDNGVHIYDFSAFQYCWTDRFGGVFEITDGDGS